MRIAILQRDPVHCKIIEKIITDAGHTCLTYQDGMTLSKALARSSVDMLVLDWHGSRLSGADILKSVRSVGGDQMPVMFASADGSEESMVRALSFGADDYMKLPVRPFEFRARVRALLRRAYPERHGAARFDCGPYHFDTVRGQQSLTQQGLFNTCSKFVQNYPTFIRTFIGSRPREFAYKSAIASVMWPRSAFVSTLPCSM
ncbi:response regulator [Paraburkholderia saeva]|uniref:response regulator n=1 Tax=Paraburkholderia saeva TaxID=2777537 RepID=UPI001DC531D7|nr:response regulator [Paraburkholderia saeva]CAG4887705.1 Response regulator MprA [Paraburkholderia saeva]